MGNTMEGQVGEELYDPNQFDLIKENLSDPKYGEVTKILRNKATRNLFAQIDYNLGNQEEYEEKLKLGARAAEQQHDSLVRIVKSNSEKKSEFCSTFWKIEVLIEYLTDSLFSDILMRAKSQGHYEESELWHILVSVIATLSFLKHRGVMHGDIRAQTILISPDRKVKVLSRTLFEKQPTHFQECYQDIQKQQGYYLSPIQLKSFQIHQEPQHSMSKTDVWGLGISVLEAANMTSCRDIYNFQDFTIDQRILDNHLNNAKKKYSNNLCGFLEKMLTIDEKDRPDVDNLYGAVEELSKNGLIIANQLSGEQLTQSQQMQQSQDNGMKSSQQVQNNRDPNNIPELQQISQGMPQNEQVVFAPTNVHQRQANEPKVQYGDVTQQIKPKRRQEKVRRSGWAVDTERNQKQTTPQTKYNEIPTYLANQQQNVPTEIHNVQQRITQDYSQRITSQYMDPQGQHSNIGIKLVDNGNFEANKSNARRDYGQY